MLLIAVFPFLVYLVLHISIFLPYDFPAQSLPFHSAVSECSTLTAQNSGCHPPDRYRFRFRRHRCPYFQFLAAVPPPASRQPPRPPR